MSYTNSDIAAFRRVVWNHYKKYGRYDLLWRKTKNPYTILVSEIMLQQTQVPRVVEKYPEFLKTFPNVRALAKAPLSDVLRVWSGMGYNRRAKFLREAAKIIVEKHGGRVPSVYSGLIELPGVGDYTASAVRVFALNLPDILVETNIRAAFIHHFYSSVLPACAEASAGRQKARISDSEILPVVKKAAKGQDPRKWHWALMDYGAHIKKLHGNPARRSAHYTRQSPFEGSLRQLRGAILRALADGSKTTQSIHRLIRTNKPIALLKMDQALEGLSRDGLIVEAKGSARGGSASGRKWRIA